MALKMLMNCYMYKTKMADQINGQSFILSNYYL